VVYNGTISKDNEGWDKTMVYVWHMVSVDEDQDLGLFLTAQVAMKHYDDTLEDGYRGVWMEWPDGTWKHSMDGDVDVEITRRHVIAK